MRFSSTAVRHLCVALFALLLCSCASLTQTPYQRPEITVPPAWEAAATTTSSSTDSWWQSFNDPSLTILISETLQRNTDLAAATLRVRRAQLQAEQADSDRLPSLSVGGSTTGSRTLSGDGKTSRTSALSATISYEQDLWGKLGSTFDAARFEAEATAEDRQNTVQTVIATSASLYWKIAYLGKRIDLSENSVAYAGQTLKLAQVRLAAGAATPLEVLEAEQSLAAQEASQTSLLQQRVEARHALAILMDEPPQSLWVSLPENLDHATLPNVAPGLPAELLARRPDLRAAEARLRSTLAASDSARADLYPTLNLSGSLGGSSEKLSRLLSNPLASLAGELALPFVQWRELQRNIQISETEHEEALLTFRKTFYKALAEVEDSLSARQHYKIQEEKLTFALKTAKQVEHLQQLRYQTGSSPLTSWLDAQESRRQAEINLLENRFKQLQNHITLCQALGGTP